jgi:hypothetical protein
MSLIFTTNFVFHRSQIVHLYQNTLEKKSAEKKNESMFIKTFIYLLKNLFTSSFKRDAADNAILYSAKRIRISLFSLVKRVAIEVCSRNAS